MTNDGWMISKNGRPYKFFFYQRDDAEDEDEAGVTVVVYPWNGGYAFKAFRFQSVEEWRADGSPLTKPIYTSKATDSEFKAKLEATQWAAKYLAKRDRGVIDPEEAHARRWASSIFDHPIFRMTREEADRLFKKRRGID